MKLLYDNWDEEIARCLICDGGCQVRMENGTTLLHKFAEQARRASFLINECKCDPFQTNDYGYTILECAILLKIAHSFVLLLMSVVVTNYVKQWV